VLPERGGKYSVSVWTGTGAGSILSEEQLMQKRSTNSNSIDFDRIAKVRFG